MSASFEMDPVDRITASAVGPPGERTFYVQARATSGTVTLVAEKEQVRLLAQALLQLLETLPEADWRVGEMSIEYEDLSDRIAIVITEIEDEDEEALGLPGRARLVATRAQARALAQHALEVVAAGRPRCQFCGYPLETEGHICPAMNGHRSYRE